MNILHRQDTIQAAKQKVWYFKSTLLSCVVFYMLKTNVWYNKSPNSWRVDNSATDPYIMMRRITSLNIIRFFCTVDTPNCCACRACSKNAIKITIGVTEVWVLAWPKSLIRLFLWAVIWAWSQTFQKNFLVNKMTVRCVPRRSVQQNLGSLWSILHQ